MKQLVILSGKGGTGKTSISAAFAHLSSRAGLPGGVVLADADVDAANLGLVLSPAVKETTEFWGGSLAEIDPGLCIGCGECFPVCRYDAVLDDPQHPGKKWIDPVACDGCAACVYACPTDAIRMVVQQEGFWFRSDTPYGTLLHAELFPGRENSGKLVTLVKQNARLWAEEHQIPIVVIDGPPGIGCPVISACAGADLGMIVAEPSLAGIHDLKRVQATLQHFRVPQVIAINKTDIYPDGVEQIRRFAYEHDIQILGQVPFDPLIPHSMLLGSPVTEEFPDSDSARAIRQLWDGVIELIETL